ncbi:flagellar protein [Cohnella yongneupensis]|uniref:Flagellar protein n=1 Tax=Cohnella yongneupensis TaxID=425006 RepID=A0ABW0QX11_9BACL
MNLAHCPRCSRLFSKHFREVCNQCHQDLEKEYERCVDHLRKNKGLTIQELSNETETSIKQITRWLREGRISLLNAPNMTYPCEVCGTLIRESNMCDSCRTRLQKDVNNAKNSGFSAAQDYRGSGGYQITDRHKDRK